MNAAEKIDHWIKDIEDLDLRAACRPLLHENEKFLEWPAAIKHHHNYPGGLIAHPLEVCELALGAASVFPGPVNRDVLIAACLWHDLLKIREYEVVAFTGYHEVPTDMLQKDAHGETTEYWKKSGYLEKIGHIAGSTAAFLHVATSRGVSQELIDAVCHCILSHHGRADWGSPVEPQSVEALLLHHADMLSAKFGPTRKKQP